MKRLIALIAVCFVDMIGLMIVAPLLPFFAVRLGAAPSLVGPLVSSFAVAQLLASPLWGRISDRYGRRPVLLIGLAASATAYLIFGFANALWLLFVCRLVQGFGGGTTGVAPEGMPSSSKGREPKPPGRNPSSRMVNFALATLRPSLPARKDALR